MHRSIRSECQVFLLPGKHQGKSSGFLLWNLLGHPGLESFTSRLGRGSMAVQKVCATFFAGRFTYQSYEHASTIPSSSEIWRTVRGVWRGVGCLARN